MSNLKSVALTVVNCLITITITITMRVFSAPLYTKPDRLKTVTALLGRTEMQLEVVSFQ